MSKWLISVPCWGDYHVNTFLKYVLPSLRVAIKQAGVRAHLIIHTEDQRVFIAGYTLPHDELDIELRTPAHGSTHHTTYGNCHRDVIRSALPGERVMLMNADIVVSRETFSACEQRFTEGKKLVVAAATRCLFKPGVVPTIGAKSRDMLEWTLGVKHPSVAQCFWGTGRTMIPWAIYFQTSSGVVIRGFHLHPLAFIKQPGLTFHGTSLDEHLIEEFSKDEIHVVTSPDEFALAELSPPAYLFKLAKPMNEKTVYNWALQRATARHRWLFEHRIIVSGTGEDQSDVEPCNTILEKLKWSRDTFNGLMLPHFVQVLNDERYDYCKFFAYDGRRVVVR